MSKRIVSVLNGRRDLFKAPRKAFMDTWANLCAPVCGDGDMDEDGDADDEDMDNDSRCLACDTCVCSVAGKVLDRYLNSFETILKKQFVAKSDLRQLLNKGHIVARFTCKRRIGNGDEVVTLTHHIYVHLGVVYWSPFMVTGSCLTFKDGDIFDKTCGCLVEAYAVFGWEHATIDFPVGFIFV